MVTFKYKKAKEEEKEFYFYLGLLSTLFAQMESNILSLLGKLITDNFVLTSTILERNSLAQNIDLLKKINKYRSFEENAISKLITKVASVRKIRNLFIHGIWGGPIKSENDLILRCYEPKVLYESSSNKKEWSSRTRHEFRLTYIRKLVEGVEDIITVQDYLIKKLDNHNFD